MHVRETGEIRKAIRIRHMCSVPSPRAGVVAVGDSKGGRSFFKDVRKISVGDCALFEPSKDSPPFIGIIRSLGSDKENLQLRVNRLYRAADIKLVKGVALEAAPNEVFYSFRSDEIPAVSLLHPCKVAFLSKGVELPSGVSSFVCRRVYDTTNKRLGWLSDREFIYDQQEEVNQLLRKTQFEMHATVQQQQGVRSPKPGNSPMSTSQLKQSPDSGQNSATTFPSHPKGKKRERSDQVAEPTKRERTSRADDGDFGLLRSESMLKSEIARITDKGGLVDSGGVERLVQFMHRDKSERRIDLTCRSLLAGVIAATDKDDCLRQFVQLRGLPYLDEWLQDVHKGKVGDSTSPRDHDRPVEDFLLVLLRALDKLPVNLNALQMCNIGKSVNHLRSHRNSEIQKKARSLVDTWKKRVEAEMNSNDAKSGSSQSVTWTARTRHEAPHSGNRHTGGLLDTSTRNSVPHQSSKSASIKLGPGEAVGKTTSAPTSLANVKLVSSPASTCANMKDGHLRISVIGGNSEPPQSSTRDDKSSSSSPSHTNSQCSSDQAKNLGVSGKEDTRSSNSGSTSLNKSSGGGSRQRKSTNGLQGSLPASNIQRDGGSSRNNSLARVPGSENLSQSSTACERNVDAPVSDSNNHKFVVKISNRGRSPAQIVNGGSTEDASLTNSRACYPVQSEKHGQSNRSSKDRNDTGRNNTMPDTNNESWQSNDLKDVVTGCGEGYGSPAATPDFGRCDNAEETGKLLTSKSETKPSKLHDSTLSSINALIESCVKYSEGNGSMSSGDDGGMNLLASVAAGEILKSDGASPPHSPQGSAFVADETVRSKHSDGDVSGQDHIQSSNAADIEAPKPNIAPIALQADKQDQGKNLLHDVDISLRPDVKINQSMVVASVFPSSACVGGGEDVPKVHETKESVKDDGHICIPDRRRDATEDASVSPKEEITVKTADSVSVPNRPSSNMSAKEPPSRNEKVAVSSCIVSNLLPGQFNDEQSDDEDDVDDNGHVDHEANKNADPEKNPHPVSHRQEEPQFESDLSDQKSKYHEDFESKEIVVGSPGKVSSPVPSALVKDLCLDAKSSKLAGEEAMEERSSDGAGSSGTGGRFEFDLNEGFNVDDSKDEESLGDSAPICLSSYPLSIPLPASYGNNVPSLITVTSAAKGAFVPPEDLLRNKGELGWKGSAATSAFRPAEPRKLSELPLSNNNVGKKGRVPFEIDLNVADESIIEDLGQNSDTKHERRDQCGFDLDLNTIDEAPELTQPLPGFRRSEARLFSNGESSRRDFDLNNGPTGDEVTVDSSSYNLHGRPNVPFHPSIGFRLNNTEVGNLNSWYPTGSSFSAIQIPTPLPDMERQSYPIMGTSGGPPRMLGPPMGTMPFNPDMYRGSVLSSSPAVPFPGAPFQYPVFPFGTSFPLPSSSIPGGSTAFLDLSSGGRLCIPTVPSQLVGSVSLQYPIPRPYVVGLSDVGNSVAIENTRKWGRQGLDLNAGPGGGSEVEGRDETLHIPPQRAVSTMGPLGLADEQSRMMYPMAGGILKRKEPDVGWDADRLSGYKQQHSWQ